MLLAGFAAAGAAALALILRDELLLLAALGVRVVRDGEHQADAVFLIDLRGGKIVVDRHDVDARMHLRQAADHALAANVVGQAAERLGADDVFIAVFGQLQHFGRQQRRTEAPAAAVSATAPAAKPGGIHALGSAQDEIDQGVLLTRGLVRPAGAGVLDEPLVRQGEKVDVFVQRLFVIKENKVYALENSSAREDYLVI